MKDYKPYGTFSSDLASNIYTSLLQSIKKLFLSVMALCSQVLFTSFSYDVNVLI